MKFKFFIIGITFFLGFPSSRPSADEKPYDYVVKNALVFDGEALVPIKQDIAILGDQIVQIGEVPREEGREVIEAEGLVASPGFIDIHTHSDFNPFVYPNLGNKVLQGVTTEVVGNCGMSAAPVEGVAREEIANIWRREGVKIPPTIDWKTFREYTNEAEFQGLETNLIGLVGHGNLRMSVIGRDLRAARSEEIEAMKALLNQAFDEGSSGISFGLTYLPGISANREELVALCQEAAKRKKLCVFHMRSEGSHLPEAVQEVIEVARESKAAVHISHLKAAGEKNWPKISEAFQKIEAARAEGLTITADAYPYAASFAELGAILPDKFYRDPKRNRRFQDPAQQQRIVRDLEKHYQTHPVSWDRIRIATVTQEKNLPFQGKTLLEISRALAQSPERALVTLLGEEDFKVSAFYFSQNETVVGEVLSKPYVAVGSDSIADGSASPHPRAYGTFPKMLGRCPRGELVTSNPCWGRTIHQMTGFPAKILGLRDRGRIGTGIYADLVLFDPAKITDRADYANPKTPPEGIRWVFVNGRAVVREGKYEPVHSGVFLNPEK